MVPLTGYLCGKPQNTVLSRVTFILMRVCISAWSVISPVGGVWTAWGEQVDSKDTEELNISYICIDQQTTCYFHDECFLNPR